MNDLNAYKKSILMSMYYEAIVGKQRNERYVLQNLYGFSRVEEELDKIIYTDNLKLKDFKERLDNLYE